MKRLILFLIFLGFTAHAEPFAALSVIPAGSEQFDLSTGVTTLPEGGKIIDIKRALELESSFIRYEEGTFISAQDTVVQGEFGTLRAPELVIDLEQNVIKATGELSLENETLLVIAQSLTLFLEANVARLEGGVTSRTPEFEARVLIIDLAQPNVLLGGPYSFQQGLFSLEQASESSLLHLRQEKTAEGYDYLPNSQVEVAVLERLGSYLP